jgi:hypothetical protein
MNERQSTSCDISDLVGGFPKTLLMLLTLLHHPLAYAQGMDVLERVVSKKSLYHKWLKHIGLSFLKN